MNSLFDSSNGTPTSCPPKRKIIYILPLAIIIASLALFAKVGKESFAKTINVDVAKARLDQTITTNSQGETLFQAVAWVQAYPYPTRVSALVGGFIDSIEVKEGDFVKKDQVLAILNTEDLLIAKEEKLLTIQSQFAEIEKLKSELAILDAEKQQNESFENTAQAELKTTQNRWKRLSETGLGTSRLTKEDAQFDMLEKQEKVKEYEFTTKIIQSKTLKTKKDIDIIQCQIAIEKKRLEKIELDLKRSTIVAPHEGIIEQMYAKVGRKQMLNSDNELSTTVVEIFNPSQMQVRVDVPLNEINKVKIGQNTKIKIAALKEDLEGQVIGFGGKADYQKNTLDVYVKIPGTHLSLRPEMLAQVEFISNSQKN